ncbi:hypothetical protein L6452_30791 [Arctium lappa]|uniref:Uncharacterized protein n=1 Tax=Arctium lappa TaxID=4217 RepID=A0ACB8ZK56_ARCLA|nr:hypothetical protein L6452_30791 [Arctium lappa]
MTERSSSYNPSEDYTLSPEEEQLETLKLENAELEWKNDKLQEDLERLQREYLRDRKKLNLLQAENGGLIDKISALEWDKDYSGVARKYISGWAQCYQKGPRSSVLWRFRPSKGYEQWLRDTYYPL